MKKILAIIALTFIIPICLTSCNDKNTIKNNKLKVALITNGCNIDDNEINENTWNGIDRFMKSKNYIANEDYTYLIPNSNKTEDLITKINEAVSWGANTIICPGFVFNEALYKIQDKYEDVKFLIEDGIPCDKNLTNNIGKNTVSAYFNEHELGFYAGYSAVKEGYTNLGFIGGGAIPNVQRFGIGFTAGAYYSAFEDNIDINIDDNSFIYVNSFKQSDSIKTKANILYKNGIDLLLCSAGDADLSVMQSAEKQDKKLITSDFDNLYMSDTILTAAVKKYDVMAELFLESINNDFNGGKSISIGTKNDAVSLVFNKDNDNFTKFNKNDYDKIYQDVKNDKIQIPATYDKLLDFVTNLNFELNLSKENVLGLIRKDTLK